MKFLDFPDVIPDEAQQAPIPRQSLVMRLGARRHPCASQPDHKFTVAAAAARFGFSLILSRYNRIFIVMRMVILKFHHQEINMLDVSVAQEWKIHRLFIFGPDEIIHCD